MDTNTQRSLYERLGQKDGITRIVDDVMANHLANPVVQARFENIKDLDHARRMAAEFFCAGCGRPARRLDGRYGRRQRLQPGLFCAGCRRPAGRLDGRNGGR